jgi:hypothetical protein
VYRSGGECCGGSIPGQNISVSRVIWAPGNGSTVIASGALRSTWEIGRTLGVCAETIFLQQSWARFAGLHGMVWQHFIVCWSADIAMQSANCASRMKLAATTRVVILRNINPALFLKEMVILILRVNRRWSQKNVIQRQIIRRRRMKA